MLPRPHGLERLAWLPMVLSLVVGAAFPYANVEAEESQSSKNGAPQADAQRAEIEQSEAGRQGDDEVLSQSVRGGDEGTDLADRVEIAPVAKSTSTPPRAANPKQRVDDQSAKAGSQSAKMRATAPSKAPTASSQSVPLAVADSATPDGKTIIGASALVLEKQSQLLFPARVDTGAKTCSIHAEEVVIEESADSMEDNIGKVTRIKLVNPKEEAEWVETRINRLARVKTSERAERRYVVSLVFAYNDIEKEVSVTLNDRSSMLFPLLLGRNFLQGDFVVDVAMADSN